MREKTPYEKGTEFTILIERAWKFDNRINKKVKRQYENLLDAEKGTGMKSLGSFEKQLKEIKETLEKVFTIFLKQKLESEKRSNIENCLLNVSFAKNSDDIYELVKVGIKDKL
jgi:hypothetical protein